MRRDDHDRHELLVNVEGLLNHFLSIFIFLGLQESNKLQIDFLSIKDFHKLREKGIGTFRGSNGIVLIFLCRHLLLYLPHMDGDSILKRVLGFYRMLRGEACCKFVASFKIFAYTKIAIRWTSSSSVSG